MSEAAAPVAPVASTAPTTDATATASEAKPNAEAKPQDAKPAPRKLEKPYEFTHKGKKVVIDTEDKALHYMSKGFGGHELFEQARKEREEADATVKKTLGRLKSGNYSDVLETLTEQLGSEDKAMELMEQAVYERRVKQSQLTPEQRRIQELEAKEAKRLKDDEATQTKAKADKETKEAEAELDRWSKVAIDALSAAKVKPDFAPVMLARMRPYIDAAIAAGGDPMGSEVVADFMEGEKSSMRGMVDAMEPDALAEWFGEENLNRLRKWDLQRLRAGRGPKPPPVQQSPGNMVIEPERPKQRSSFWDVPPHK